MTKVLIICYGNPLRSDDGLGWRAAEELIHSINSPDVEVIARFQLTPELADDIHSAQLVFFIDASRDGEPGELSFSSIVPAAGSASSHHLSPSGIIALARQLHGTAPAAFAVTVCGECFELGDKLSPKVAAGLPRLTALVTEAAQRLAR
jgi:hydrogenase maturation protease